MIARDCPSNPFQANMILPLKNREREEVAKSDPTVPVLTQGQQLEGMHCRNIHIARNRPDVYLSSMLMPRSGLAMLTRQAATLSCRAAGTSAPRLCPRATLSPTGLNPFLPQTRMKSWHCLGGCGFCPVLPSDAGEVARHYSQHPGRERATEHGTMGQCSAPCPGPCIY